MNVPPTDGIRVPVEDLRQLVAAIFGSVPIPEEHARLVADLLIDTELRGVVSHGVRAVERYVRSYQEGSMNPRPEVRVLREGPATAALSGDGGLGMMVATRAMEMAILKAEDLGVGVVTTTYHDHVGSSGKYVRMALKKGLIGISLSGRSAMPEYDLSHTIHGSIQGSPPLAFGMPAGEGKPEFLLDLSSATPWDDECFRRMPQVFIKAIGIAHVANILSGTLGGQMLPEFDRRTVDFSGANQSGFHMALDVESFTDPSAFKADMDHLMTAASSMKPLPGFDESSLPGGRAWKKEREYLGDGIPISAATVDSLSGLAAELGLSLPSSCSREES
ncbi:Ldh family oxidoreductase [Candidatus Latescibacterota bacterium]